MSTFEKVSESASSESAKTLVQLALNILKGVGKGAYDYARADKACASYYENYLQRHGTVKVLGMHKPASLADLYTEVQFLTPKHLSAFETVEGLTELYKKQNLREFGNITREKPRTGLSVANSKNNRFLSILGAPGAGKTTFLKFLGLAALQGYKRSTFGRCFGGKSAPYAFNLLPVYLPLRDLRRRSDTDFANWVDEEFSTNGFPVGFGRSAITEGHCLVLLDGLDEIPDHLLDNALPALADFVDRFPKCRYLASCRTAFREHRAPLKRFTDIILTDFSDKQIEQFINNWFTSDEDFASNT